MRIYVWWRYLPELTSSYHSGGGCLVVARSLERARELVREHAQEGDSPDLAEDLSKEPDYTWAVAEDATVAERCVFFPDAGCC